MVAVLGSTRLPHVLVQSEVETVALDPAGTVRWRVAHGDVVASAELVAGRLAITSYSGGVSLLDPAQRPRPAEVNREGGSACGVDGRWMERCLRTPPSGRPAIDPGSPAGLRSDATRRGPGTD